MPRLHRKTRAIPWRDGWGWLILSTAAQMYLTLMLTLGAVAVLPALVGWQGSVIQSGSMEPHISTGDVVVSAALADSSPVPVGGVVQFRSPAAAEPSGVAKLRLHRIVRANDDGTYVTAGDANRDEDSTPLTRGQITGQARLLTPFVGLPSFWLGTGSVAKLTLWIAATLLALLIVGASVRRNRTPTEPTPPDSQPPLGRPATEQQAKQKHVHRRRHAGLTGARLRRGSAVTAMALGMVLASGAILPLGQASAAFSGHTANAGNSFTVGAWEAYRNYRATIAADGPWAYYPMDEAPSVYTAQDQSGNDRDATYSYSGVATNAPGALVNETNRAISLNGTQGAAFATPSPAVTNPTVFSVELWFNTGSGKGGELASFGTSRTGTSSQYDRNLYLGSDGHLNFGVYPGVTKVITSPNGYNDSAWHHVAATLGPAGMALYVDGKSVVTSTNTVAQNTTGYWRIGGDNLSGWPNQPTNTYFTGSVDEVSVYNTTALSPARIKAHYDAAQTASTANYPAEVAADKPSYYYHLEEGGAGAITDSAGQRRDSSYPSSGIGYKIPGVLQKMNNRAATFSGVDGVLTCTTGHASPQVFSTEAWFKTTTTSGGQLIGFGSTTGLSSAQHDRHLYMANGGQLTFGVYPGSVKTITSPATYNDGQWHHTVATLSSAGMKLYVDGSLVASDATVKNAEPYTGYWHIGAGLLAGLWPSQPSSNYFNGTLDEVAIYTTALDADQVAAHYRAR